MKPRTALLALSLSLTSSAAHAVEMSPDYLVGAWCFTGAEAGGTAGAINVTYIFRKDGTVLTRTEAGASADEAGNYSLTAETLSIEPTLAHMPNRVLAIEADAFVLGDPTTQLRFRRGACR